MENEQNKSKTETKVNKIDIPHLKVALRIFPFNKQESIRTKANRPLRDRNPNIYNLILKRPQNDLDLEMTLTLR